jgi:hypothetical protein
MIAYDLRCEHGHIFEGWFKDAAAYERQEKRKLVSCGICGTTKVKRAPMAPAVAGTRSQNEKATPIAADAPLNPPTTPPGPGQRTYATHPDAAKAAELMAELRKLRDHVEKNADYVGPKFAEEARKIHYGEKEKRNIYGEASESDAAKLAEEGIEFARVPWIKPADS